MFTSNESVFTSKEMERSNTASRNLRLATGNSKVNSRAQNKERNEPNEGVATAVMLCLGENTHLYCRTLLLKVHYIAEYVTKSMRDINKLFLRSLFQEGTTNLNKWSFTYSENNRIDLADTPHKALKQARKQKGS